jgi:phospholipid transport system substrate-binding protein
MGVAMTFFKHACIALIAMAFALAPAYGDTSAPSDPAAGTISTFYAALTDMMRHGKELGAEGRYQKLAPAVDAAFNIPLMVQFAVGPAWTTMPSADHDALIAAFRRYTIADYTRNFDHDGGEKFAVDPKVIVRGEDHIVRSTLMPPKGDAVSLNYRMRLAGGNWKIVDVFLAGYVSELSTRRSDYASTIASGGAAALVKKLNTLSDNLMK